MKDEGNNNKEINDVYEEDDDSYADYRIFFTYAHSKCPICGTTGYHDGICVVCDFPDYEL